MPACACLASARAAGELQKYRIALEGFGGGRVNVTGLLEEFRRVFERMVRYMRDVSAQQRMQEAYAACLFLEAAVKKLRLTKDHELAQIADQFQKPVQAVRARVDSCLATASRGWTMVAAFDLRKATTQSLKQLVEYLKFLQKDPDGFYAKNARAGGGSSCASTSLRLPFTIEPCIT